MEHPKKTKLKAQPEPKLTSKAALKPVTSAACPFRMISQGCQYLGMRWLGTSSGYKER
jgi:hypothetical protein